MPWERDVYGLLFAHPKKRKQDKTNTSIDVNGKLKVRSYVAVRPPQTVQDFLLALRRTFREPIALVQV